MDGERVQLSNKEYMDGHNLNRSDKYVKTKNSHGCFEINSMSYFSTWFTLDLSCAQNMVRVF